MDSIPFKFDSVQAGLSECAGILHLEEACSRFEYRYDVGGLGIKSGAREAAVGFDEIASIDFKRGWFGAKAILRPHGMKILERFPATSDDSVVIHFRRRGPEPSRILDFRVDPAAFPAAA